MNEIVTASNSVSENTNFDWLAQVPAESVWLANFTSTHTRRAYRRAIRDFVSVLGIETPEALYAVSQSHIIVYREALRDRGLKGTAIGNRLAALSSLYSFLADKQLVASNPVSGVKRPPSTPSGIGSGKTPALTKTQVRQLLDAPDTTTLKGLRDRAILHVLFYAGARISEPAKLKVRDFRMAADYWVLEFVTKGERTNVVAINQECQIALRRYLAEAGHENDLNAPLFQATKAGNNHGQTLRGDHLAEIFKTYAVAIGLPPTIAPHSARATFITEAYAAGLSGEAIQRTVGHASVTTTEGYNRTAKRHRESASFGVNY